MTRTQTAQIRRTTICVATAVAIALPSVASAGIFDKVKSRAKVVRNNATTAVNIVRERKPIATVIENVRENRPIATALGNAAGNLPGADLIARLQELRLREQLENTIVLLHRMQAEYQAFSGGTFGCEGPCVTFRNDLKGVVEEFLSLAEEVPVLEQRAGLINTIDRLKNLVDVVPPRALYLMWQVLRERIDELYDAADQIRQGLQLLPLFVVDTAQDFADGPTCQWVNRSDKPAVEWVQAELERIAWGIKMVADFVPDIEVKGELGAEAGIAVANATGAAGAGMKPTDVLKTTFKVMASIPEFLNHVIKVNIARVKMACATADFTAANLPTN